MEFQSRPPLAVMVVAALLCSAGMSAAHEPIFGVGPHTLFQGGIGAGIEGEFSKDEVSTTYEMAYGITPNLTVTGLLLTVNQSEGGLSRFGFGDATVRVKWRILRFDAPSVQDGIAIVGGVKLPSGSTKGDIHLGTGSTDYMTAITYGHEGRRWYWWGDARYLLTTECKGINRGDVLFYDAAFGVRPWLLTYEQPDLVFLAEFNGRRVGAATRQGADIADTGGQVMTAGPALFFTYKNYALKAGVAFPVAWQFKGNQNDPHVESVVAFEVHL